MCTTEQSEVVRSLDTWAWFECFLTDLQNVDVKDTERENEGMEALLEMLENQGDQACSTAQETPDSELIEGRVPPLELLCFERFAQSFDTKDRSSELAATSTAGLNEGRMSSFGSLSCGEGSSIPRSRIAICDKGKGEIAGAQG
jgi:hypothetical protein